MLEPMSEAPKREEQVLVLAAGGLTDKEIAVRLGISPDTVGTYWRRVLAKYQAASRTEVVAKYMEERSQRAIESLSYVNECMRLINEHMISMGGSPAPGSMGVGDAILASLSDWILLIDGQNTVVFSNRMLSSDRPELAQVLSAPDLGQVLAIAAQGPIEAKVADNAGTEYDFTFAPGVGTLAGHVVASGRVHS